MSIAAIIVAAGRGQRAGEGVPKQRRMLGDRMVFQWSLEMFCAHPKIDTYVLVVPQNTSSEYAEDCPKEVEIVEGGATRTSSVQAGLKVCENKRVEKVLIHDAARPGLNDRVITQLIHALDECDAAAPALPVADALKRQIDQRVETVDRSNLFRVQTPQAFHVTKIVSALAHAEDYVDDLVAIEALGGTVRLIEGSERLAKITYPDDLRHLERLLMPPAPAPRFGTGYDVHALEPGDGVTLCGTRIPHTHRLAGHSDADVAWHALTDAILGAAALGDIGDHFPPSDEKWKGADSALFLAHAVQIAREAGWKLTSCDLTIVCEAPKVKPHREKMRSRTAEVSGLPLDAVSVKATTTEGLGFTGRKEGIAAYASAVLSPLTATA
ncbi:MAG: bifunctional 2-C-methyl-D-erythritol 4-phosphate cytidylyltransferase/2-C-methyl-D-erythritol 2,4-cyclodiphosphate synthase [Pseudomonadota bacterium]